MKLRNKLLSGMLIILLLQSLISGGLTIGIFYRQSRQNSEEHLYEGWQRVRFYLEELKHQLYKDINLLRFYLKENITHYDQSPVITNTINYFINNSSVDEIIVLNNRREILAEVKSAPFQAVSIDDLQVLPADFRFSRNSFYIVERDKGNLSLFLITGTTLLLADGNPLYIYFVTNIGHKMLAAVKIDTGINSAFFAGNEFICAATPAFSITDFKESEIRRIDIVNTPYKALSGMLSIDVEGNLYLVVLESIHQEILSLKALFTSFAFSFIAAFSASILVAAVITAYFISPFTRLNNWLHTYMDTGKSEKPEIHTSDEIGFLADTFYSMVSKIIEEEKIIREQWDKIIVAEKVTSLGLLSAGMAHEINNPLGSILSHVNYLTEVEKDAEKIDSLNWIENSANRIADIINRILAYAGKGGGQEGKSDLNRVIQETLAILKHDIQKKKIDVSLSLAKELPEAKIHEDELKQVILNLFLNAIQAVEPGGIIIIESCLQNSSIIFKITDNGRGIKPEFINNIFDPFFTTRSADSGSGLGLSVSYNIIKNARGDIRVESKLDKGTVVEVLINVHEYSDS